MKTTLFMAVSINGYVTGEKDDTEWVKDTDILYKIIAKYGACVMGKRTYFEADKYDAFPYKNALNIVMTHDQILVKSSHDNVIFTDSSPNEVISLAEGRGHGKIIVVGGGHINSEFLSAGLIDDIIIDIHSIIINKGIRLFEENFPRVNLDLLESRILGDGIVQNHYRVIK